MIKFFKNNTPLVMCVSWGIGMCAGQIKLSYGDYFLASTIITLFSITFFISLFYEFFRMKNSPKILYSSHQTPILKNELMFPKEKYNE